LNKKITKIGVLTSGGDAPGMNAAIRAVVRTGIYSGLEVFGIMRGFSGMIDGDIFKMESKSVANIIQRGGTILKTARSKEFYTTEGRETAYNNLKKLGINGLVIIGGDGSFRGAQTFSNEFDIPCIGLPGTIDKDTADAHDRLFIIEVMGRDSGYIALHSGIATGAENILIPERKTDIENVINSLVEKHGRKKLVNIIVVAEGEEFGAYELSKVITERIPEQEVRVTILGHIQRGGSPSCFDRLIASRMGYSAVECLLEERFNVFVGIVNNKMHYIPLDQAVKKKQKISEDWMKIVRILSS
jgi:6-phosphofructokinase 1